jgi:hypothetical protein
MYERMWQRVDSPVRQHHRQVVQRRLTVGRADDRLECEADRIADDVLRALRAGSAPAAAPFTPTSPSRIVRSVGTAATAELGADGGEVSGPLARRIRSASGGSPLPAPTLARMEAGFGARFSDVRVHRDSPLPAQLSAEAFTVGTSIHIAPGRFAPTSRAGEHLLAHELAHVVQQTGPVVRRALTVDATRWSEASRIAVSGGGSLTGVFFLSGRGGETLVIKAAKGGARSQLAAEMMGATTGEHSYQRTILLDSGEGKSLLKHMHRLASKYRRQHKTAKGQNPVKLRIASQLESGKFDAVTVTPMHQNLTNLEDIHSRDDFPELLQLMLEGGFFADLGRIHAADMVMGNEDRLERMNDKNFFVDMVSGGSVGLDLDLNAASFDQVVSDIRQPTDKPSAAAMPSLKGQEVRDYVQFAIHGTSAKKQFKRGKKTVEGYMGFRGLTQATADTSHAADPAKAAKKFDDLITRMTARAQDAGLGNEEVIAAVDWAPYKKAFLKGLTDGLETLAAKMGRIEARAGRLTALYGDDAALDPLVFKIRLLYAQLIRNGYDETQAVQTLEGFVRHVREGGDEQEFFDGLEARVA